MIDEWEKYEEVLRIMKQTSNLSIDVILDEMIKPTHKDDRMGPYFIICIELFRGVEVCCDAIADKAYSQMGTLLRQMLEQVSIAKVLYKNMDVRKEYIKFHNAMIAYLNNKKNTSKLDDLYYSSQTIQKRLKGKSGSNNGTQSKKLDYTQNFFSYGWIEKCGAQSFSSYDLLICGEMDSFIKRRKFYNNYVHNHVFVANIADNLDAVVKDLILTLGVIYNDLLCSYHFATNFDFDFDSNCNKALFDKYFDLILSENQKQ